MKFSIPIDVINYQALNKSYFFENYISKNKPAIIKGILQHSPANTLWTLDRMYDRLGDYPIKVFDNKKKNGTSYIFGSQTIPMRKMLDLVRTNSSSNLRMFVSAILRKDKKLASELPCPDFFKGPFQLSNLLFLGGKGCVVPLHYDFMRDEGLLTQLYGRKDVILIDRSQSDNLYRLPFNTTSMVNLFEPDYEKYPALKYLKGSKVTLEHGDSLYIPSGYWHQLKYVDASMSVAYRKWNANPIISVTTAVERILQIPFDKTMQALLGDLWLNHKKNKAKIRAEKLLLN